MKGKMMVHWMVVELGHYLVLMMEAMLEQWMVAEWVQYLELYLAPVLHLIHSVCNKKCAK